MVIARQDCKDLGIPFKWRQGGHHLMQYFRFVVDKYNCKPAAQEEVRELINHMSYKQQILFVFTYYDTHCVIWMMKEVQAGRIINLPWPSKDKERLIARVRDYQVIRENRSK